ncbi:hypothetical protein ABZX85_01865 [Streptomyces sp. NPDC004539]|uniref:hypothetical protein n=1 Tax=Streptomyces sp. NPDC004539 TaxID=3154280 RepID=UPI0033B9523A
MQHRANDPVSDGPLDRAPFGHATESSQREALYAELGNAGVELGIYDHRIVEWLAGWDYPTIAAVASLLRRTASAAASLPAWEAVYEPGNVSDYLVGYTNDECAAKAAAEAWLRPQKDEVGRLEWVPWGTVTTPPGDYDVWFELSEQRDGGIPTNTGLIVRHLAPGRPDTHPAPGTGQ